ncbi:hypothetical protein AB0J83_20270 [Actinoplanes sp. NPDC049596]|uniref:hypothetical protein n=1 Tax=unclassified Actinoplanes TaxID=2626549 RepID=UPI0034150D5A
MHVLTRVYGPDHAQSLVDRIPERLDLEDPADSKILFELGLTPDRLAEALGGEL